MTAVGAVPKEPGAGLDGGGDSASGGTTNIVGGSEKTSMQFR